MTFPSFKKRIFLLALFPVLGIVVFSLISINSALKVVKQSESAISIIELSFVNNALVHEIQKERGMSNVFFYTKGLKFLDELKAQRKATDLAFIKRKGYLDKLALPESNFNHQTKLVGKENLALTRRSVDEVSITSPSIIRYYSQLNSQLINTVLSATTLSSNAQVNNLLHALYNLVMSKEYSGIERALLADIFSVDGFNQDDLVEINRIRVKEETYLTLFSLLANKEVNAYYQQAIRHESFQKVQQLRNQRLNEITSDTWFYDASQRINELQAVEEKITELLLMMLKNLTSHGKKELIFSSTYGFLSVTLTIMLFIRLYFQIIAERKYKQLLIEQKGVLDQFKIIVDNTINSVVITNPQGIIEYVNKQFTQVSGFEASSVIGEKPTLWNSGSTDPEVYTQLYETLKQGGYWQGELQNKRKNGELYWARTTMFSVKSPQNHINKYICIQEDITQQKYDKETIEHLVNHDTLTGLPSLRLGKDRLEQAILAAQRHNLSAAVMFIDLDGFKQINDEFGHAAGDRVLIEVGQRIVKLLRQTDTVARIGGDEFIVIMTNIKEERAISQVAMKIIDAVKSDIPHNGHKLSVTASIGIAKYPFHGTTRNEMMRKADKAMYAIKGEGKNNFAFYRDEFH